MPTGYQNYLSINQEHKTIPYGGAGELRQDGGANYGFVDLKSDITRINNIPELLQDKPLKVLIQSINTVKTGILSIGCDSILHKKKGQYRYSGYIEFAFNSVKAAIQADRYFSIYFEFDKYLKNKNFSTKVEFNWTIQPATFIDKGIKGYTCTIYLNTFFDKTKNEANTAWQESLNILSSHLEKIPDEMKDYIFFALD